jgi:hypothetical protein
MNAVVTTYTHHSLLLPYCCDYILIVCLCRLYLGDKELNVVSYSLLLSVLEYQTAVMRGDFETADRVLPTIPRNQRTRVAHFLEKQVCISAMYGCSY